MTTKSATLYARIEPGIKKETEEILDNLGLSMSDAINIFCRQVIIHNGIPFRVTGEAPARVDATNWTAERLAVEIDKAREDVKAGRLKSADEVFAEIEQR